ncbi:helix-turn-helix domain-containing protein [Cohnella nanjingensis]|uniref:AraC family transcriptional regulator n=1 Tax=Cohnella nanjingensis TaxID=1387779 RepID=A0A7X0RWJ0_9BACL|nr:AraC family transcriptional regulator [Cohnella nanjingensis]MBB6674931.1 AraC family transcriptional regulator [Cohnella nanjingensis]
MNPMPKRRFSDDPLFPFDIVHRDTKSPETELPDHLHDRYEIVYIHQGKGTFFIDQSFFEMRPGDLFVIPGNTIHRAFPDGVDRITSTAVFFAPPLLRQPALGDGYACMRIFEQARREHRYRLPGTPSAEIERLLDAIQKELRDQASGYRQAVLLELHRLLLALNRMTGPAARRDAEEEVKRVGPHWMQEMLRHIDRHPGGELSLSSLSERAAVTPAHFSRVFKQLTGMNVTAYVNAKRIAYAKEQLVASDDSVDVIATRSGYESLPHFHRMFKQLSGQTPAAFKRSRTMRADQARADRIQID